MERGSYIFAYDEHGHLLFGNGPNDRLIGFTGSTVTVRFGSFINTYDEHGITISSKAA